MGKDGGQGRALYPHVEYEDEDGVQNNVDRRPQQDGHHAHPAKALGVDERIHPQADHDEQSAPEIDGHVAVGVGEGVRAGPEEVEDGLLEGQEKGGAHRPQDEQQQKGAAHHPFRLLVVPPAPADGAQGRAPGAAQVGEAHQNGHDGHGHPQAGEGQAVAGGEVAQVDPVHHAVQHVDQLGRRHGQGQTHNVAGDASPGKVVLTVRHGRGLL